MKQYNTYDYQIIRGIERKLYLVNLRGGKCEKCGYSKNLAAFDFHHIDPKNKNFQLDVRKLSNSKMEYILNEFNKCLVLCSNCHRELHNEDMDINFLKCKVKDFKNSLQIRPVKKPKCIDCEIDINYGYKRCKPCNYKYKTNPNKPEIDVLKDLLKIKTKTEIAIIFNVSRRTINRWLSIKIVE
jgi:hypothetical protein